MRKEEVDDKPVDTPESLTAYQLKSRLTWAALIKCVYEVDPPKCPKCGTEMKIVGYIERESAGLIRMILSAAGLWREPASRAPPVAPVDVTVSSEPVLDY